MIKESASDMQGTVHEKNWYFIHDALSLMTAKSTMEWMSKKGHKAKWLVPQKCINIGTRYHGRPVGNSPEFMPLDNSLNADMKRAHDRHVALTMHLRNDDPMKFSNRTPKAISRGIKRIVESVDHGCPSSPRIIQDCDKVLDAMWTVCNAKGESVRGLAD